MGTTKRKTKAQLEREIDQALRGGSPVGRGELLPGSSVVLPHKRTSPTCKKCGQFHTQAEHYKHASSSKKMSSQGATRSRVSSSRSDSPLEIVMSAVRQIPKGARFGRDVFVYPLWQKVGKKIKMSLTEFKRWLVEQNRMQNLSLVRADLVDAMDSKLVERSEIDDLGGQFHFVIDPDSRRGQPRRPAPPPARTEVARTPQGDVDEVKRAIQSIHGAGRFGDRKVFISEVWRRVGKKLGMSLETFKQWLVGRHISQSLVLARADLVSAMDPELVASSETFAVPGEKYPVYHFVIDDSVR